MAEVSKRDEIRKILKNHWGYESFRSLQEEIILSVLAGNDTLALLPTGGGKSICFQVPALAMKGLCLVVSPLIALMKDQVYHLKSKGIKAVALYSGMKNSEMEDALSAALFDPVCRFLYISPERLQTPQFRANVKRMPVKMIAVDEAHCISQWGYDFRPPYLEIAAIREQCPGATVLALTATATPAVAADIQNRLNFKKKNLFQKSFRRENLTYFVVSEEDKNNRMLRIMQHYRGTGIVYVRNRRKTAEAAEFLRSNGIAADFYHAGLDPAERDRRQDDWMSGKTRVIVATNAFGMGIDKPDVRFVIHLDLPDSIEAYFQEAGRGGRDEKPAAAILLYDQYDLRQLKRSFTLSFPPLEKVREVYEELCQHFRIAMGGGKNAVFPFYAESHIRAVGMTPVQYFNALKLLEMAGAVVLSRNLRKVSQIRFRLGGDDLLDFEQRNPELAEAVKTILRSYGGVFTQYVEISERTLAERIGITETETVQLLQRLRASGVIYYSQQSDIPLIIFMQDRLPSDHIYFDPKIYEVRKERALLRMQAMVDYVTATGTCRSQLLLAYFGEKQSAPCGECDVCRKAHVTRPVVRSITEQIKSLSSQGLSEKEVLHRLAMTYDEQTVTDAMRKLIDLNGKL